jgi:hypothetical protein
VPFSGQPGTGDDAAFDAELFDLILPLIWFLRWLLLATELFFAMIWFADYQKRHNVVYV